MALPALPASNANMAKQQNRQQLFEKIEVDQLTLSRVRNSLLDTIDATLIKMFNLQQQKFNIDMLDRQRMMALSQADGRDRTIEKDDVPEKDVAALPGFMKGILGLTAALAALGTTFLGFRGFINPLNNAKLGMKLLRAIYIAPINFFRDLGVKVAKLLRLDVAFDKLKRFFLRSKTLNYLFGGARNLSTGQFQRIGLIPRVINLISTRVSDFFKSFRIPTIGGLKGKGGAFAMIKGLFSRVLSPIRAVGTFISESKIFNNPIVRGGIAFFKMALKKILFPLGLIISAFAGVKQAFSSDEETLFGKFVDGVTTAVGDFIGAPLDMLKNGLAWLLRKTFGIELGEDGKVKADEGVIGKIIQGVMDFSFEDAVKGLLMLPFNMVKAGINTIKALFKGEEDPLRFIRNPVMAILRPIIGFLDTVKNWIVEQIKKIPVVGDLFATEEEQLAKEIDKKKNAISDQKARLDESDALIEKAREEIRKQRKRQLEEGEEVGSGFLDGAYAKDVIKDQQQLIEQIQLQKNKQLVLLEEKEEMLEKSILALELKRSALDQFDSISNASGNGAADAIRAMESNKASSNGMQQNNAVDNSVQTVNNQMSETVVGGQNVSPRGYTNYGPQ